MLLNDIGKSPDTTFRKINQHLEANYGFKIAEDTSDKDLVAIMEHIEDEIVDLKIKGDNAQASPEISKRLLVLEGIRTLREFAILQFQSPHLEKVVKGMIDFVVDDFTISGEHHGDFEQSIKDAMKQYRSSKYRFPDDAIEQRVRQGAQSLIQSLAQDEHQSSSPIDAMGQTSMFEDDSEDEAQGDSEMQGIEEGDPWGNVPAGQRQRDTARGGAAASDPSTPMGHHAAKVLNNPSLSLAPQHSDEQVPMIRNTNRNSSSYGKMVPDPEAAQKAQRRKGIVMKEHANLVKNLRRLLETEVSQAEVMMAAKGFAQELQEMIEKIGRLQNEDLPPVTDQMRETYGTDSSSAFQTQIYGALQGVMDALYTAKGQVDDAVSNMASTGQFNAPTDMDVPVDGMDDGMGDDAGAMDADMSDPADLDNIAGDEMGDEFGAEDGEEPLGRAMKESKLQRKVLEMKKLVAKARELREGQPAQLLKELSVDTLNNYRTAAVKDIDKKTGKKEFGPALDRAGKTATATQKIRSQGGVSKSAADIRAGK
jgi:hypothetical protein